MIIRDLRKDEYFKDGMMSCLAGWCRLDIEEEKKQELKYTVVGAFADDGETIMSKIGAHNYQSYYCGQPVKALGIGGVATAPMYRRSGGIREIFRELFRRAEDEQWIFSYLYPFSFPYYRQYGYERISRWQHVTMPISAISHLPRYSKNVKLYEGENPEALISIYNDFASRYEVAFYRTADTSKYSKTPYQSGRWTFYTEDAYVTVEKKEDTLFIYEMAYRTSVSLMEIVSFLRMFDGQVEKLYFERLPEHSELDYILADYGHADIVLKNEFMGRVINVQKALELYSYPVSSGSVSIQVNDPMIESNQGVFSVEYKDGHAVSVNHTKHGTADITVTIPALTRLLLGDVPVYASHLTYMPGITWHCEPEKIRSIFVPKDARIFDFF